MRTKFKWYVCITNIKVLQKELKDFHLIWTKRLSDLIIYNTIISLNWEEYDKMSGHIFCEYGEFASRVKQKLRDRKIIKKRNYGRYEIIK